MYVCEIVFQLDLLSHRGKKNGILFMYVYVDLRYAYIYIIRREKTIVRPFLFPIGVLLGLPAVGIFVLLVNCCRSLCVMPYLRCGRTAVDRFCPFDSNRKIIFASTFCLKKFVSTWLRSEYKIPNFSLSSLLFQIHHVKIFVYVNNLKWFMEYKTL